MINVIPAIDLMDSCAVRLTRGAFDTKKIYSDCPADLAKEFYDMGFSHLHIVDLDGARAGKPQHLKTLSEIAAAAPLSIDFSGGIRSIKEVEECIVAGARFITIGSLAVKNPDLFFELIRYFSPDHFILGADTRSGFVSVDGWQQESNIKISPFIKQWMDVGIKKIMITEINRDGTMMGPAVDLYIQIQSQFPDIEIIASGGVSGIEDVLELQNHGFQNVIVGKALYEKKEDFKTFLQNRKQ